MQNKQETRELTSAGCQHRVARLSRVERIATRVLALLFRTYSDEMDPQVPTTIVGRSVFGNLVLRRRFFRRMEGASRAGAATRRAGPGSSRCARCRISSGPAN